MSTYPSPEGESEPFVNAFGTSVEREGDGWVLRVPADGGWRVISRHATEEAARNASREMNASANRDPDSPPS